MADQGKNTQEWGREHDKTKYLPADRYWRNLSFLCTKEQGVWEAEKGFESRQYSLCALAERGTVSRHNDA